MTNFRDRDQPTTMKNCTKLDRCVKLNMIGDYVFF